jgi:putative hydrolase of the HAD superfamily
LLQGVYIIDADNTLWDTNAVFLKAQLEMIRTLRQYGCGLEPEAALQAMRALDLQIAFALDNFEYDFSRLACALLLVERGLAEAEAVQLVCAGHPPADEWNTALRASHDFYEHVNTHCPPLFAGVTETLTALRAGSNTLVLHSEGLRDRVQQTLAAHALEPFFDCVVLERKSRDSFRRARLTGEKLYRSNTGRDPEYCVVVGDSPKRDIRFGNLIGATTVLKPGGWLGVEIPDDPLLTPHFTIENFFELLELDPGSRIDRLACFPD